MKKINRFLVVALLLPHLAACGGAATRSASPGRNAEPGQASPASTEKPREDAPEPSGPDKEGSRASTQAARSPAPDESPRASTAPKEAPENDMAIDVSMSPSCVRRTQTTTMTVKAERFSDISYGVAYADGQNHGQYGIGRTNAKGVFVKSFLVPLDAAAGEATVLIAAVNPGNNHGGTEEGTFEVVSTSC